MAIYQNPNKEELQEIIDAVAANEGYCPCEIEKNQDTKCPCKKFRDSDDVDFCHCGRYYKIPQFETLALVADITDGPAEYEQWEILLSKQNFVVLPILFDAHSIYNHSLGYQNLSRTKIAKADAVMVLDSEAEWVEDITLWAELIGKKVLKRSDITL